VAAFAFGEGAKLAPGHPASPALPPIILNDEEKDETVISQSMLNQSTDSVDVVDCELSRIL
jgi:hypothetical protein